MNLLKKGFFNLNTISIIFVLFMLCSCVKSETEAEIKYRVTGFTDGFEVKYKLESERLYTDTVKGAYTLAKPWVVEFLAKPGDIVYVSVTDTVLESYTTVQILVNGKVFKQNSRGKDRYMPIIVSGIVGFD